MKLLPNVYSVWAQNLPKVRTAYGGDFVFMDFLCCRTGVEGGGGGNQVMNYAKLFFVHYASQIEITVSQLRAKELWKIMGHSLSFSVTKELSDQVVSGQLRWHKTRLLSSS